MTRKTALWQGAAAWACACLCAGLASAAPVLPADLSPLTDFGTAELQRETALIYQVGDKNDSMIDQSDNVAGATGQYAEIVQNGSGNVVKITQLGDQNRIRVNQNGSGNVAKISQTGARNLVDLVQQNQNNYFEAIVEGNDNVIKDIQGGNADAYIDIKGNNNVIVRDQSPGKDALSLRIVIPAPPPGLQEGLRIKIN